MLTEEQNKEMTQVGQGTPMGELLRRYWHPIAPVAEMDENPTREVRLLGEDLVLYKDRSGNYGLIDRYCAHRRVNLAYGIPEEDGLRCMYHGWKFDCTGQCIEQPFEETVHPDGKFKQKIKMKGYPVQALAGLLWAYLGPEPAPLVPVWEPFTFEDGYKHISISELPCNWLQAQENSIDPVHAEWLHAYWAQAQGYSSGFGNPRKHKKIGFNEFDYGISYHRVVEGSTEEDDDWAVGRTCLFPYCLFTGNTMTCHFEWRVPIDDENTLSVSWYVNRVAPGHTPPKQDSIPYFYGPVKDENGRYYTNLTINQDIVAWASQGKVTDRQHEHLGESDRGVIQMRKLLQEQARVVEDGGDPKGTIRDPEKNRGIKLPLHHFGKTRTLNPDTAYTYRPFQAGEPEEISEDVRAVVATWSDA